MNDLLKKMGKNVKLNSPATEEEINNLKNIAKCDVPKELIDIYKLHNGGEIFGHDFLSISEMIYAIQSAESLKQDSNLSDILVSNEGVKAIRWSSKRFPFIGDGSGNYIAVDCDVTDSGCVGQIINYGGDEKKIYVFANNIIDFLNGLINISQKENTDSIGHLTDYLIRNNISFFNHNEDNKEITTLKGIPKEKITYELANNLIEKNPKEIMYVPKDIIDKNLYIKAVSIDPFSLKYFFDDIVSDENKYDIYMAAIRSRKPIIVESKENKNNLENSKGDSNYISITNYMSYYQMSEEQCSQLCLEAMKRDMNIIYKGFYNKTAIDEKCYKYIISEMDYEEAIKYIPDQFKVKDKCIEVLKKDGMLLEYVPMEYRDIDTLLIAVCQNPEAIKFIRPEIQMKNEILAIEAVKRNGLMLKLVYFKVRTEEVCKIAYQNNPDCLKYIPNEILEKLNITEGNFESKKEININNDDNNIVNSTLNKERNSSINTNKKLILIIVLCLIIIFSIILCFFFA